MGANVVVAGSASKVGSSFGWSIDEAIRETVLSALSAAGMASLDEIDTLVTVGSDILDATTVAGHSGIAGSYGHSLLTVPSSAGHALAAAVVLIESGAARNVLLAGWGEGSKFQDVDGRIIQADPFYARPLGAGAAELAVMQAQRLVASGLLNVDHAVRYAQEMSSRSPLSSSSGAAWLQTIWCDGACALVLAPGSEGGLAISVRDFGSSFQPYCPEPEELDPSRWVSAAQSAMRAPDALDSGSLVALEVGGPTAACEVAAVADLLAKQGWDATDPRVNSSGGSAHAYFGPATGLQRLVSAVGALERSGATESSIAAVIDLAGPIGQATSLIVLERGSE
jgi:3-oxoacyl-[acyl-carrier-protein] synthase III